MFFYVLHLYLIHVLAIVMAPIVGQPVRFLFHGGFFPAPGNYGDNLPFVYLMWITAVVIL